MRRSCGSMLVAVLAVLLAVLGAGLFPSPAFAAQIFEKDINLDESNRLAEILRSRGLEVVLTRTTDIDLPLAERARRAAGADLLVSVHNNGSQNRGIRGTEVYAQVANGTSQAVARRILDGVVARAGTARRGVFTRPGERGDYYAVLRNSPVPGVIVEGAYLSNPDEARLLAQPAFRQRLAEGIADGIVGHFVTASAKGPGPAPPLGPGLLPPPPNTTVTRAGPNAFRVSWSPVLGASGYEVWRDGVLVAGTDQFSFVDGGLAFGGHHYEVRAVLGLAGLRVAESASAMFDVALGRIVIDPGHGGPDPGAVGTI